MKGLAKFLVETILGEAAGMDKVVVVYSGRFQPFHKGHYATYDHLVKKFGKDSVYIGTSNVTDSKKSPFNFKEKKAIMTTMFGIPSNKIVNIKNPYAPEEILNKFDSDTTGFITVVGEKDASRLSGKYFKQYKGKVDTGYLDRGYVYAAPAQPNPISGTDVRYWLSAGSAADRKKNFTKAYPKFDDQVFKLITLKLKKLKESINEEIKLNVKVGDTLLMGKFKNKKVVVKNIGTDEWGMPTINGKKAVTFRIPKKEELKEVSVQNSNNVERIETDDGTGPFASSWKQYHNQADVRAEKIGHAVVDRADDLKKEKSLVNYKEMDPRNQVTNFPIMQEPKNTDSIGKFTAKRAYTNWLGDALGAVKDLGWEEILTTKEKEQRKQAEMDGKDNIKVVKEGLISEDEINQIVDEIMNEMGLGGGAGVGLSLPGGYINGAPKADDVKKVSKKLNNKGMSGYEEIDEIAVQIDNIPGGLASGKTLIDLAKKYDEKGYYDPKQYAKEYIKPKLMQGIKVEMEHTTDVRIATEIAMDHLWEDLEYYDKLAKIENPTNEGLKDLEKERDSLYLKALKMMPNSPAQLKVRAEIDKILIKIKNLKKENINESLLVEGGAYGHMAHPFDIEMGLTFADLKQIVVRALNGDLELAREKTDGQALAVSWVNGRLVAARNKSHLKNKGAGAMTIGQVADKFAGRGGLTDAYNFAMQDLSKAIAALSEPQRKKIFKDGGSFMNLEVIYPTSVNVIPYNQPLLVFHGTFDYDVNGTIVGENQQAATILGGMIKQVNAHVQSKYTIQGPPMNKLPKSEHLSKLQGKYISMITKLQSEFGLSDSDGVADYHQAWWTDFVEKKAKKLDTQEKIGLVKRWAFGDKSFRINTIQDVKLKDWAEQTDKQDQQKISKQNLMRFEEIFLGVGADVLSFMSSVLTANPDSAKRQMVARLESTIQQVKASGDPKKIAKLKLELQRLNALGGFDKIVPNEGIVFVYGGNTYKLTGAFAPLNQILGIFFDS
jgi:hypothetical protein